MDERRMTEPELEAIERDASLDLWAAAPASTRGACGLAHRRVGDGVMLQAAKLGSMVFNRLLGYGVAGPARADELDAVIAGFERSGTPDWVIQVAPSAADLAALAAARGLEPHPRSWVRFTRGAEPASAVSTLAIRPAGGDDAAAFGSVFCAAFGLPVELARWIAGLPGRPRWRCFLAWDGEMPVGTGALYLGDGLGWLGLGGTLPSHRGRGGQAAMLAARIEAGRAEGCRGFTTETGVPLPGEAAPSFRNILRAGFREVYRRQNLRRPPTA